MDCRYVKMYTTRSVTLSTSHGLAGCNIGSFGSGATGVSVQNVVYRNVTISNSDAGVEFKSYPNCAGTVRNISYYDFTLVRFTKGRYFMEVRLLITISILVSGCLSHRYQFFLVRETPSFLFCYWLTCFSRLGRETASILGR